jgi:alpha-D-ribose 1-methylphosphonate 5-triphosphate diphosphatase PhnM
MSLALLALIPQLLASGVATMAQVKSIFSTAHPGMTEAELDAVCDLIAASAAKHKALADADLKSNTAGA